MPVIFNGFEIALEFTNKVLGGIPTNQEKFEKWCHDKQLNESIIETIKKSRPQVESDYYAITRDDRGIYIPASHIKAHIRDKITALGILTKEDTSDKVNLMLSISPKKIRLKRYDKNLQNADGLHKVKNQDYEYIAPPSTIIFRIYVPNTLIIFTKELFEKIFIISGNSGFGTMREYYGNYKLCKINQLDSIEVGINETLDEKIRDQRQIKENKT